MATVFQRLRWVVVEQLDVKEDKVVPAASFSEDLGADSLDRVELIMAVEEAFSVEITDTDAEGIVTVQDAVDFLFSKGVIEE